MGAQRQRGDREWRQVVGQTQGEGTSTEFLFLSWGNGVGVGAQRLRGDREPGRPMVREQVEEFLFFSWGDGGGDTD